VHVIIPPRLLKGGDEDVQKGGEGLFLTSSEGILTGKETPNPKCSERNGEKWSTISVQKAKGGRKKLSEEEGEKGVTTTETFPEKGLAHT